MARDQNMADTKPGNLSNQLSRHTSIFGLKLWVILGISFGSAVIVFLFLISLWFTSRSNNKRKLKILLNTSLTGVSKEIIVSQAKIPQNFPSSLPQIESIAKNDYKNPLFLPEKNKIHVDHGKNQVSIVTPEISNLGWGSWYSLKDLQASTKDFAKENVIGEGGYGIVYRGLLEDGTQIAVKSLLNNREQAEKEFKVEVDAIGRVRHKNLVRLLGYCVEGANRMLVYEFIENGNLEQWLHGNPGLSHPLTWDIRMTIILGTAKGLAYLHEGLEPKVVHRDIKSSNILLDKQWTSKVSDFGLAKLLASERSYVTTRVMGTFGYVAPEYASTGMLNEKSDVYSFGILVMEIVSGRNPVDNNRPMGEVNLVDWLKGMVATHNAEGLLDPKLPEKPSSRVLKRVLLVALRCVNPDAQNRPKMGQVVSMLEGDDLLFHGDQRTRQDSAVKQQPNQLKE